MNSLKIRHAAMSAAAVILAVAGQVRADLVIGAPVVIAENQTVAAVEFLGSSAGHTGQLYFLGSGQSPSSLDEPVADTGAPGLGQLLFNNHTSAVGSAVQLDGVFNAGDILHFAYDVIAPSSVASRLYLSTDNAQRFQFAYDSASGDLFIEDLPLPGGDQDYNDAMFNITFASVPAPGCLALLSCAGLCAWPRRRGA